ncbi:helix-turn-helix transcriptional regulator [Xanthomonas albilineans]|uniref:helix-turn-helix transcriptional regulator n=1 Tax=Xanthomonas albilineans TaxID=29447 RepID=UPI0005F32C6A|nr:helix-turn-helix transcriptional regulator [Xanthomonas albilineans]
MIGDRLKELREAAGMNQPEFAAIAKTSKQYVGRLEKGYNKDPNPKFIELWARHFGVRMEWITAGQLPKDAGSKDVQGPAEVITAPQVDPRILSRAHALLTTDHAYDLGTQEDAILFARAYEWIAQQSEVADSSQSFNKFLRWAAVRQSSASTQAATNQPSGNAAMSNWRGRLNDFADTEKELTHEVARSRKLSTK